MHEAQKNLQLLGLESAFSAPSTSSAFLNAALKTGPKSCFEICIQSTSNPDASPQRDV
jgi:hypothetical protein